MMLIKAVEARKKAEVGNACPDHIPLLPSFLVIPTPVSCYTVFSLSNLIFFYVNTVVIEVIVCVFHLL